MKWWDVKTKPMRPDEPYERTRIRAWLKQVPHGAIIGNTAMLLCYNRQHPERSFVIVEEINI